MCEFLHICSSACCVSDPVLGTRGMGVKEIKIPAWCSLRQHRY